MRSALVGLLLASVPVGGSFGEAGATTISINETSMVIDVTVEVPEDTQAVVIHIGLEGETTVLPMVPRSTPGTWGIRTEVARKNWQVIFEILGPLKEVSGPMTLGFLGADFSLPGDTTIPDGSGEDEGITRETKRWGYLGLAFGAAALSLLAFWVLGAEDKESGEKSEEE